LLDECLPNLASAGPRIIEGKEKRRGKKQKKGKKSGSEGTVILFLAHLTFSAATERRREGGKKKEAQRAVHAPAPR